MAYSRDAFYRDKRQRLLESILSCLLEDQPYFAGVLYSFVQCHTVQSLRLRLVCRFGDLGQGLVKPFQIGVQYRIPPPPKVEYWFKIMTQWHKLTIIGQKVKLFYLSLSLFSTYARDLSNMPFERYSQYLSKYLVQKIYFIIFLV